MRPHAESAHREQAADTEEIAAQEEPVAARLDLRLLLPALTAWSALVALVVHGSVLQLTIGVSALAGAVLMVWLDRRWGRSRRSGSRALSNVARHGASAGCAWTGRGDARVHRVRVLGLTGLIALCLAATALVLIASAAHRATQEAGTLPELAGERAVVRVTGTVLTEPRLISRGDERPDMVVLELGVRRVEGRGAISRINTPVVVFADASWLDVTWRSTVSTLGRLGPPEPGDSVVAVLTPLQPPTVESGSDPLLEGTEHMRERLRQSVEPLPVDARALIPGLVIGDTSLTPLDLKDAMLATGMSHLSAVSGTNVR